MEPARTPAPPTGPAPSLRHPTGAVRFLGRGPLVDFVRRPLVWQTAGLTLIALGILGVALLRFDSYVTFGNLELPYTVGQYRALLVPPGVWTPYQYYGFPTPAPFVDLVHYPTEVLPLALLAIALGPVVAAKIFLVVSTVFLGVAFLLFARSFVRTPWGQFLAAAFLLAGPFQLALYGQGDFQQFVSEGLIFLGLFCLWRAAERPATRWAWFPLSLWLLVLSVWSLQMFTLGVALYLVFGAVYLLRAHPRPGAGRAAAAFYARFGMLPVLLGPLVVTVLLGALNLGASSPQALPLPTFVQYGAPPWRIFFLFGYFNINFNLVAQVNFDLAVGWSLAVGALLALVWIGGIVTRDRRIVLFFAIALGASFLGADAQGPLGPLNVWLYLHVTGLQALNASYYWDWMVVAPVYALAVGALYETLRARSVAPTVPLRGPLRPIVGIVRRRFPRPRLQRYYRNATLALVVTVVLVAAVPYGTLAQYEGSAGMHSINYPADYGSIPPLLAGLVGGGYAGVALFNPDVNWFLFNSTHPVQNVFFLYPSVRTVGISTYGSYPTPSNTFAYWVYQQFYSNTTRYAGALFATIGVEYFLVFDGAQSASDYPGTFLNFSYGQNASRLMADQVDVVPVYTSASFVLYRNLFYGGVAAPADHLSLVAGDYTELDAIAYAGVNLTDQAFLYPTDLTPTGCAEELPRVDRVYAPNPNALFGIALPCSALASIDPVAAASPDLSPSQAWAPSTRVQGVPSVVDAWPGTLAVSDGGRHVLEIPVGGAGCGGGCRLWLPVRFGATGGSLAFSWGGASETFRTGEGYDGVNNSMVWVELPFVLGAGGGTLTVTAISGWNAIGSLLVEGPALDGPGAVLGEVARDLPNASFFQVTPSVTIDRVDPGSYGPAGGQGGYYAASTSGFDPAGSSLLLQDLVPGPIALPLSVAGAPLPGWLSLLVREGVPGTFRVSAGGQNVTFGYLGPATGDPNAWSWDRIYVNGSSRAFGAPAQVTLESGALYLAEVVYVPAEWSPGVAPIVPGPSLSVSGVAVGPGVRNLTVTTTPDPWGTRISGEGQFPPGAGPGPYATVTLSGSVPAADEVAVAANVSTGLLLSVDGQAIGGTSGGEFDLLPNPIPPAGTGGGATEVTLDVSAGGPTGPIGTANFSLTLGSSSAGTTVPFGDLGSAANMSVGSDSAGYSLTDPSGNGLLLVRVAFYAGLVPTDGATLAPALGSLTTLVWNPERATALFVTPSDANAYAFSIGLVLAATAGWVAVELAIAAVLLRRRRRTSAEQ